MAWKDETLSVTVQKHGDIVNSETWAVFLIYLLFFFWLSRLFMQSNKRFIDLSVRILDFREYGLCRSVTTRFLTALVAGGRWRPRLVWAPTRTVPAARRSPSAGDCARPQTVWVPAGPSPPTDRNTSSAVKKKKLYWFKMTQTHAYVLVNLLKINNCLHLLISIYFYIKSGSIC